MGIYLLFIIVMISLLNISMINAPKQINELGVNYNKVNKFWIFVCAVIMILFYAFRGTSGTDSGNYITLYNYSSIVKYNITTRDFLFWFVNWIDYHIFNGNVVLHNIVLGCITYIPVLYVYSKYTEKFNLSILLYIIILYCTAFNIQRQYCAISICLLSYVFFVKKQYRKFILCIAVAYGFHSTSIIFLLVILFADLKTTSKPFLIGVIVMIFLSLNLKYIWNLFIQFLYMIHMDIFAYYYADVINSDKQSHIINALMYLPPILLGFIYYKKISGKKFIHSDIGEIDVLRKFAGNVQQDFNVILNINIMGFIFNLAGMSMLYLNRLGSYSLPFLPVLIVRIGNVLHKNEKIVYYFLVILLYGLLFLRGLKTSGGLLPYDFENGIKMFLG